MIMKNSILFLTNAYPDFEDSYRGIFIKKMAELLQGDGYELSVVTPKIYKGSSYFEEQNGIKVYRFPFFSGNKLLIEYEKIPYLRMIFYYISGFLFTFFVIFKHRCHLIHAHWAIPTGLLGVLVGDFLRKPVIVTIHGSDLRMALKSLGFLRKLFIYVCKKATHLNCVSEMQKKGLEQLKIENKRISIIPMSVDEAFLEVGKNRKMRLNKRPSTILSNRNLLPIYNVSLLIRAIPMVLKEEWKVRFLIAGDGSEREELEKKAKELNVIMSIKFLGRVPHDNMPNVLAETDIYVSTSPYDGTSVSLLEAMASGVFPVVTDIPSNREWITHGENGFLVPADEEKILASKILEAMQTPKLLELAYGKNIEIIEQRANWRNNIRKIVEIYSVFS